MRHLSRICEISAIQFSRIEANKNRSPAIKSTLEVEERLEAEAVLGGDRILVSLDLAFSVFDLDEDDKRSCDPALETHFKLDLLYTLQESPTVGENALGAFAFLNAAQSGWPYFRSALSDIMQKFGFPNLCLPVRRIVPRRPASSGAPEGSSMKARAKKAPAKRRPAPKKARAKKARAKKARAKKARAKKARAKKARAKRAPAKRKPAPEKA